MRNLLAFVGAAVVVFLGLGWYLGWYNVTPEKAAPGQSRIQVDINKHKIGDDVKKGAENVQEFIDKARQGQPRSEGGDTTGTKSDKPSEVKPPSGQPNGTSTRAKDTFRDYIVDGWFTGEKK